MLTQRQRNVAEQTLNTLITMREKGQSMVPQKLFRNVNEIENEIVKMWENEFDVEQRKYISNIVASLISTKTLEESEYQDELNNYLTDNIRSEVQSHLYQKSKEVIGNNDNEEVEDEDDGEELCDCEFTLAYGTKILLHNTKLKIEKG